MNLLREVHIKQGINTFERCSNGGQEQLSFSIGVRTNGEENFALSVVQGHVVTHRQQ